MFQAVTEQFEVVVVPEYLAEQSRPLESLYVFAYHVSISNQGDRTAQLLTRRWLIRDSHGRTEEVAGPGVIGEQPHFPPGHSHTYTSFCPLQTETGSMEGVYGMRSAEGVEFEIAIPRFELIAITAIN